MRKKLCRYIILILIILLASFVRLYGIGTFPGNKAIWQDEAIAGYNAWALGNYGRDMWGYVNPVYSNAWGSGQSMLQTYIMIPFIKLIGLNTFSIRLPMAILGIISVVCFYLLLREGNKFWEEKELVPIIGAFIMAIMPWNIMISRWALDCNFFPGILLLSVVFAIKSIDDSRYIVGFFFFYGISLYAYAAPWIVMPFLLLGIVAYLLIFHTRWDKNWTIGVTVLTIEALPLILFVLVNLGYINEIRTSIISIPRLDRFRGGEVGIHNLLVYLKRTMQIIVWQTDEYYWNSIGNIGIYYKISLPFIIIGALASFIRMIKEVKKHPADVFIWEWFVCALILGSLIYPDIGKINIVHMPIIYFAAVGISTVVYLLKNKKMHYAILMAITCLYVAKFANFCQYYFTEYNDIIAGVFVEGIDEAVRYADGLEKENVYVDSSISYGQLLFYSKLNPEIVAYDWDSFVETKMLGNYIFDGFSNDIKLEKGNVYLTVGSKYELMENNKTANMQIKQFGRTIICY